MARLGTAAHGSASRAELLDAGLTAEQIRGRVQLGSLIPQYPGTYRIGHAAPSREASYMAAIKAAGEGAFISGLPAAQAMGLVKGRAAPEVTSRRQLKIKGLRSRRCSNLTARDTWRWKGIPITSPARTLVDLAAELNAEALALACHEAGVRYKIKPSHVEEVLKRAPNAPGAAKLRAIIAGDQKITLSKLERLFLKILKDAGLPLPLTNVVAGTRRVDCRWSEFRLTAELNSFTFHNSRKSWEGDYQREREARARGDDFRRFTWADVYEDQRYMLRELRELLS